MINALSIDLEYWYSAELVRNQFTKKDLNLIDIGDSLLPILDILDRYNTKATFFVLGLLAEKHPDIIQKLSEAGHEIASHCYSHIPIHNLGKKDFEDEIKKSVSIIKSTIGKDVLGFRAPSFSIDQSTRWALKILERNSFLYDSSVFPLKTPLYGVSDAPSKIYKPSHEDIREHDDNGDLYEVPMSVYKSIPISGGFYFRIIPYSVLRFLYKKLNESQPFVFYLHPWELEKNTPRIKLQAKDAFITYYGINSALKKFERLVKEFHFAPIQSMLEL